MKDLLFAIDCGTQSLRSIVFDTSGEIIAIEKKEYEPYTSPQPGWAEQDADLLWAALIDTASAIFGKEPALADRIAAVGITSQRDTMICMNSDGGALRPAITWLDTRKDPGFFRPNLVERIVLSAIGMNDTIKKSIADGKVNWIIRNEPHVWEIGRAHV